MEDWQQQPAFEQGEASAPPITEQFVEPPVQEPGWPKVIGIIGIVLGVLAAVGGLCGSVMVFAMPAIANKMNLPDSDPNVVNMKVAGEFMVPTLMLQAFWVVTAIMLIRGSVHLLNRRAAAVGWLRGWAVAKIIYAIALSGFQYVYNQRVLEAMIEAQQSGGPNTMPGFNQMETVMQATMAISLMLGMFWVAAFPIFILIWFSRQKIKGDIRHWQ